MNKVDKQALHERYSSVPAPKCPICGVEMTIQRISGLNVTYGCTGATYDDLGSHYAAGRSIADDHYQQSRVTIVDYGDPDVLALLDENEELEKRVAELEAREVTTSLPGGFSVEEARCLQADLVRGHISKALSGEKMNPAVKAANLRWIHDVLVRAAWFVKASIESAAGASKGE